MLIRTARKGLFPGNSGLRTRQTRGGARRSSPAVQIEPLEGRRLLSVTWVVPAVSTIVPDAPFHGYQPPPVFTLPETTTFTPVTTKSTSAKKAKATVIRYPFKNKAGNVPGYLQAENFDYGGEGVAYHDTTRGNKGGSYRKAEDVDIAPTGSGGYCITDTKAGEWLEWQVYVKASGWYDVTERVASVGAGGTFHINVDGLRQTATVKVPNTRSWRNWTTITQSGIYLTEGWHMVRLAMDSQGKRGYVGAFDWLRFTRSSLVAPTALSATAVFSTAVDLSWTDNSVGETGFQIERQAAGTDAWQAIATVAADVTGYRDNTVIAGSGYDYRVKSLGGVEDSDYSGVASVITPNPLPVVITQGGTYSGSWESLDAGVPAVQIATSEPVIIVNSEIRSRGDLIVATVDGADITIRNTAGYALNPEVINQSPGRFLNLDGFVSVVVEQCYMEGTAGIYLADYRGDYTDAQTVRIMANQARNIDGRFSDGNGGFLFGSDDCDLVQFVQLNGVHGIRGAEIAWNEVINEPGKSRVEDNISIHDSSGTADSPILIHDNYLQGAYAADPSGDGSYAGGGIMLSDNGSSYVNAYGNQVIGTTNYGMAISSGHDNVFYNNRIISSGLLPDGTRAASQNVGAYIWNHNGDRTFANNSGYGNLIGWVLGDGRNDAWVPDAALWINNTSFAGQVTLATENAEWTLWQGKLAENAVFLGRGE